MSSVGEHSPQEKINIDIASRALGKGKKEGMVIHR
jgi:hypothetical protein